MAVEINGERKGVEVKWDVGDHQGDVTVYAVGEEGDIHNTAPGPNDGVASLSYPVDFAGASTVEVRDADGNVIDSGEIEVA